MGLNRFILDSGFWIRDLLVETVGAVGTVGTVSTQMLRYLDL